MTVNPKSYCMLYSYISTVDERSGMNCNISIIILSSWALEIYEIFTAFLIVGRKNETTTTRENRVREHKTPTGTSRRHPSRHFSGGRRHIGGPHVQLRQLSLLLCAAQSRIIANSSDRVKMKNRFIVSAENPPRTRRPRGRRRGFASRAGAAARARDIKTRTVAINVVRGA